MNKSLLRNFAKFLVFVIVIFNANSCRMPDSFGFYQPITMSLAVPDGPAEYKAGWHDGCTSALGLKTFANAFVYEKGKGPSLTAIYQHDPVYQTAFGQGMSSCSLHVATFVAFSSMAHGPLQ